MPSFVEFWRDTKYVWLAVVLGGAAMIALSLIMSYATCAAQSTAMRLPYSWGPLQNCIVTYKGEYVPIRAVGVRTIEMHQK